MSRPCVSLSEKVSRMKVVVLLLKLHHHQPFLFFFNFPFSRSEFHFLSANCVDLSSVNSRILSPFFQGNVQNLFFFRGQLA